MKTHLTRILFRLSWKLDDLKLFALIQFRDRLANPDFWKMWLPLWITRFAGLDTWFATRVLGWTVEKDPISLVGSTETYHFHTSTGWVVRPRDYSPLYPGPWPC